MELVVLKPCNLLEQLRILTQEVEKVKSVSEQFEESYKVDNLPNRVLDAVRQGPLMTEIAEAKCAEPHANQYYRRKMYVPVDQALKVSSIFEPNHTALAGHAWRAKMFDLLSWPVNCKTISKQVEW